jgi:hypothetical protein
MGQETESGELAGRDLDLLAALGQYREFKSLALLHYYHAPLAGYSRGELRKSAARLVRDELISRTVTNPERETRYRITDAGREAIGR